MKHLVLSMVITISLSGGHAVLFPKQQETHSKDFNIEECPTIEVDCLSPTEEGADIKYIARVNGAGYKRKLVYHWTVTRGEIMSGQGTLSITVKAERSGTEIGATLEVKGLPERCDGKAICRLSHY
jgi:hypothetical protein